ncbi:peptidoglycan DD-metalloendopeptidase family protein [candidate division WWE3 bacterium]|nr:peptidoglycan DD-metalloendopeptidase family protein [candidate division WWE3 bacterium]
MDVWERIRRINKAFSHEALLKAIKKLFIFLMFAIFCLIIIPQKALANSTGSPWESVLDKENLVSLEIAPYGILVGQKSHAHWQNPYNGIFISRDFGNTWEEFALGGYGIMDTKVVDNRIYAAAHFSTPMHPAGLYYSDDYGATWIHRGQDWKATTVEVAGDTIYLGTISNGLWISRNNGITWENAFKYEVKPGTHIHKIWRNGDVMFIKTNSGLLVSYDDGKNFEINDQLSTAVGRCVLLTPTRIYAGTRDVGLLFSEDLGATWETTKRLRSLDTSLLVKAGRNILAAAETYAPYETIYLSKDQGKSWADTLITDLVEPYGILDVGVIPGAPTSEIFAVVAQEGIYKMEIANAPTSFPFLGDLWEGQESTELISTITSFFDHEYPLLGYTSYSESENSAQTTTNFLGQREKEPVIYYSSHNGYDFGLKYGTKIIAPAAGIANYYYCPACGHAIKIDHQNGYETTYMHLQKEDLVTEDSAGNVAVEAGDTIGKVGMTGNTTGPHLHFQIKKDTDYDGSFDDEFPTGMTDPFGWQNSLVWDPWATFTWQDNQGPHRGSSSEYLWAADWSSWEVRETFRESGALMELADIRVEIPATIKPYPLHMKVQKYAKVTPPNSKLKFIEGSSFIVEATDFAGETVHKLDDFLTLKFKVPTDLSENVLKDSLKFFHWDSLEGAWEALTTKLDPSGEYLQAKTDEISNFAVFGEVLTPADESVGETTLEFEATGSGKWLQEPPLVTLTNAAGNRVFYAVGKENEYWQEYTEPFVVENEGVVEVRFRALDEAGNVENTKAQTFYIDPSREVLGTVKIENARFTVQ